MTTVAPTSPAATPPRRQHGRASEHIRLHRARRGAERDPDANLARLFCHRVCEHAVDPNRGEEHRENQKTARSRVWKSGSAIVSPTSDCMVPSVSAGSIGSVSCSVRRMSPRRRAGSPSVRTVNVR